jgi:hypothetical protein
VTFNPAPPVVHRESVYEVKLVSVDPKGDIAADTAHKQFAEFLVHEMAFADTFIAKAFAMKLWERFFPRLKAFVLAFVPKAGSSYSFGAPLSTFSIRVRLSLRPLTTHPDYQLSGEFNFVCMGRGQ